ncbi:MAG TPA: nucleotide exchange factor GrpE [Candidatus Acidoferrum sp.]|nr:nucleotide exchange factor GrpE [Candidatus Acidoferrum sp.]
MDTQNNTNSPPSGGEALRSEPRLEDGRYLRLLADFDNYRKRVDRQRAEAAQSGKRDILLSLLDIVDDFERALQYLGNESSPLLEGVNSIYRKLLTLLDAEGVTRCFSIGEAFNPGLHEAVGSVSTSEYPPGVVVQEARPGYRQGDYLLRPARVLVST